MVLYFVLFYILNKKTMAKKELKKLLETFKKEYKKLKELEARKK